MASSSRSPVTVASASRSSVAIADTYEEKNIQRAGQIMQSMLEIVPIKSETLKVDDRKKVRDWVVELYAIISEQNGVLKELRGDNTKGRCDFISNNNSVRNGVNNNQGGIEAARKLSYADKLRDAVTVKVLPKEKQSSDATKKLLRDNVDIVENGIIINNVKQGKDGAVFVECGTKKDAEKLRVRVAMTISEKVSAKELSKVDPVIAIYGIEKDLKSEDIVECLYKQNMSIKNKYANLGEFQKDIRVHRFFSGKKNAFSKHLVASVNGKLRDLIVGRQVNLNWKICKVEDYRHVFYCYKCLGTGHMSKDCRNAQMCKKCGGGHDIRDCKSSAIKCVVCERRGLQSVNVRHEAYSRGCMSLKKLMEEDQKRTNYNGR